MTRSVLGSKIGSFHASKSVCLLLRSPLEIFELCYFLLFAQTDCRDHISATDMYHVCQYQANAWRKCTNLLWESSPIQAGRYTRTRIQKQMSDKFYDILYWQLKNESYKTALQIALKTQNKRKCFHINRFLI